jgi:FlaA1/EpsC-like NDP-sugar epimerase
MRATIANRLLQLRNRHYAFIDLLGFALTPAVALYLRTDSLNSFRPYGQSLLLYTLLALILRMSTFQYFGLYQRYWRFVSAFDFAQLVLAASLALTLTSIGFAMLEAVAWFQFDLPRSIPLLDAMLGLLLAGGVRASVRLTEHMRTMPRGLPAASQQQPRRRTLIVGAGYTGALLAREIRDNSQINLHPIGFIDDDRSKQGMQIHNLPVLGGREHLGELIQHHAIERLIIAMPSADGAALRALVAIGQQAGLTVQTMPGMHELINGNVSISKLRNVEIEDLLRRTPIKTNIGAVSKLLTGKRVLVTGGGGSIGSELCRQILRCRPRQLILLGHGENSVFEIHQELARWLVTESAADAEPIATELIPVIADLRFKERLMGIFAQHRPEVVFHAAAHKHVPLMETNPVEAITNNVLGTRLLLAAAQAHNVDRFVMISTDKAVNPTNAMGASKRVAELLVLQAARHSNRFYQVVRFGNVLGSRGSVIHTFKQQIARGGPVMVTHPEMVRYFMTIPEAVQLVLQAAVVGRGAAVLMLDMGEPVRIVDLARDLIELSGLQVGRDITITFSGLRPGEKLFEEMFKPNEEQCRTEHEKIFIAPNASQDIPSELDAIVDTLIRAALNNNGAAVISLLSELLPEYQPWPSHYAVTNHQDASTALPQTDAVAPMTKQTVVPATLTFNSAIGD